MPKRQDTTEQATLERWNTWKLYVPEGKKQLFLRFLELADRMGKSRSGAVMEAIERYYPVLEAQCRGQGQGEGEVPSEP